MPMASVIPSSMTITSVIPPSIIVVAIPVTVWSEPEHDRRGLNHDRCRGVITRGRWTISRGRGTVNRRWLIHRRRLADNDSWQRGQRQSQT